MINTKRRGPAGASDLEEMELPTSRVCSRCGAKFYGTCTDRCLRCRLAADDQDGQGDGRSGEGRRRAPAITVRTYP